MISKTYMQSKINIDQDIKIFPVMRWHELHSWFKFMVYFEVFTASTQNGGCTQFLIFDNDFSSYLITQENIAKFVIKWVNYELMRIKN